MEEINLNGKVYVEKENKIEKDTNGNQKCNGCQDTHNSTGCDNSTWCNNSTRCDNSTWCNNSTRCDNSVYCIYCNELTLEKFMVFNKQVKDKKEFIKIRAKIISQLGYYKHPKNLTKKDINWLKKNIKQFDKKVLDDVIKESILPDKPKEE